MPQISAFFFWEPIVKFRESNHLISNYTFWLKSKLCVWATLAASLLWWCPHWCLNENAEQSSTCWKGSRARQRVKRESGFHREAWPPGSLKVQHYCSRCWRRGMLPGREEKGLWAEKKQTSRRRQASLWVFLVGKGSGEGYREFMYPFLHGLLLSRHLCSYATSAKKR